MMEIARLRVYHHPDRYVHKIYGLEEAGGTCVLHLAGIPFEQMGYIGGLPEKPLGRQIEKPMHAVPFVMTSMATILGGLFWIIKRRDELGRDDREIEQKND